MTIPQTIKEICKDNTYLLDVPEVIEIIEFYENLLLNTVNMYEEIVDNIKIINS
jgi:hypothetical protein